MPHVQNGSYLISLSVRSRCLIRVQVTDPVWQLQPCWVLYLHCSTGAAEYFWNAFWRNTCEPSTWDGLLMWHCIQTQEAYYKTLYSPFLSGPQIYRHVTYECVYIFLFHSSTRESLASNTSSIVESNRRQNPALSPAHGGAGPTFNFRATADPPTSEAEKLQKPANCLQASVTSVW